jgi:hypothetical protein
MFGSRSTENNVKQFQDPDIRKSLIQTIEMLEKEVNINTIELDKKLGHFFCL